MQNFNESVQKQLFLDKSNIRIHGTDTQILKCMLCMYLLCKVCENCNVLFSVSTTNVDYYNICFASYENNLANLTKISVLLNKNAGDKNKNMYMEIKPSSYIDVILFYFIPNTNIIV